MVIAHKPKDIYRAFYTKCDYIAGYMVKQLNLQDGNSILEPCAGDGVFIEEILKLPAAKNVSISAYEMNTDAIKQLQYNYGNYKNIKISHTDTLADENLSLLSDMGVGFDRVIANPPYGGWQDYEKRKILKKLYPGFYVRETYALFLIRCINLLNRNGILCFIIPDTFFNVHMHKKLRKCILEKTSIKNIILIPSNYFPNVNFGYANLSIITLTKNDSLQTNMSNLINIIYDVESVEELGNLDNKAIHRYKNKVVSQEEIYNTTDHAFLLNGAEKLRHAISNGHQKIGDIADCVTGFYSGDNFKYLRVSPFVRRNLSNSKEIDLELVAHKYSDLPNVLEGLTEKKCFIPIVKGGSERFVKNDSWYVNWSVAAVKEYKHNKKPRFQNSHFYFQTGIAVPMVTSSKVTAALIENRIFDQSIVGIFPKEKKLVLYLLGFFNSAACTKILKTINHTANNSSNYVKKIPFLQPSPHELVYVNQLVEKIVNVCRTDSKIPIDYESKLNKFFDKKYQKFFA